MAAPALIPDAPIRVMVVDDSAVIRKLMTRWLSACTDLELVAVCTDGAEAVAAVDTAHPDVALLDVDMPGLDGLDTLQGLLRRIPRLQVVMVSALTRRHAAISLRALRLGAVDTVAKPSAMTGSGAALGFRDQVLDTIRALGNAARRPARVNADRVHETDFSLRESSAYPPAVLLLAASTGGPQALEALLRPLRTTLHVPILIAQHSPAPFTSLLADHLARSLHRPVREAVDGAPLAPGQICVAPGGRHLTLTGPAEASILRVSDDPAWTRPSPCADLLFESAATIMGGRTACAVLTGMGEDGLAGARAVTEAGGTVFAQDAGTSVVWGMPGAVARAGLCSAVAPLPILSQRIRSLLDGAAHDA